MGAHFIPKRGPAKGIALGKRKEIAVRTLKRRERLGRSCHKTENQKGKKLEDTEGGEL